MAIIFLPSGGRSMVPLSVQRINYFWVLISETDDCCFWALLPKVLWTLAHPRRENHRLFIQISTFQEQKSFWGFTDSLTSLGAHVHSCCLVLGLCSRAVFQLQERHSGPLLPKHFIVPGPINWAGSDLPFTALPDIDPLLRNPRNALILWM